MIGVEGIHGEGIENGYEWKKSNYNMLTCTDNIGKEFGTPNLKGIPCKISRTESEITT